MSGIRLQLALAKAGVASRRKAVSLIEAGRVTVNGRVMKEKGFRVDLAKDVIKVDKKKLSFSKKLHYYILNKPRDIISTACDTHGRKTVLDLIARKDLRLYPVGRLDRNTTGLMLITDDGELAYRLMHPKFGVERVYEVTVKGKTSDMARRRLKKGVVVDGRLARPRSVIFRGGASAGDSGGQASSIIITLCEGRKREVRKMCEKIGHKVLKLKRIAYGPLRLKRLKEGGYRELTKEEIEKLKNCVGFL